MYRLRATIGVGLLSGLILIVGTGFMARSSRDFAVACFGFAAGLFAVFWIERLNSRRA